MQRVASGIPGLDDLLGGGLVAGDNVVWLADRTDDSRPLVDALLTSSTEPRTSGTPRQPPAYLVTFSAGPGRRTAPPGVEHLVVDLPGIDLAVLGQRLTDLGAIPGTRIVIDGLDDLLTRWGAADTVALYRRVCPRLFDLGAVAYWTGGRQMLGPSVIDGIAKVAQCVFDLRGDRLRITKAEGRPSRVQGALVEVAVDGDGAPRIGREHTVGRLGEGLRRLRRERNLTQSQLAALAGVTPAAISQAETGRRGLSLDTLVPLCERLGIRLDDLISAGGTVDHVLARRDRLTDGAHPVDLVALFDDPAQAMRAYLVNLAADETGSPAFSHKGLEMVLVADGLVLIDLDDQTPVMRAGDALMVSRVPIRSWTNLRQEPARLFWVVSG